jgi:hypothetical protein
MPTECSLRVTSVAFCNRGRASTSAVRRQRPNSRGTAICREGPEAVGWLSSRGMRTGNDEQSAAAFPFRTQAGIGERLRTGGCYRSDSNRQNECHDAERSRPSPHEIA